MTVFRSKIRKAASKVEHQRDAFIQNSLVSSKSRFSWGRPIICQNGTLKKAKRWFIYVLIWQSSRFCFFFFLNVKNGLFWGGAGIREEVFKRSRFSLGWNRFEKRWDIQFADQTSHFGGKKNTKWIRVLANGARRSWVTARKCEPGKWTRRIFSIALFASV